METIKELKKLNYYSIKEIEKLTCCGGILRLCDYKDCKEPSYYINTASSDEDHFTTQLCYKHMELFLNRHKK